MRNRVADGTTGRRNRRIMEQYGPCNRMLHLSWRKVVRGIEHVQWAVPHLQVGQQTPLLRVLCQTDHEGARVWRGTERILYQSAIGEVSLGEQRGHLLHMGTW